MPELVWQGKYESGVRRRPLLPIAELRTVEAGGASSSEPDAPTHGANQPNQLIMGETQHALPALLATLAGQVNLIYIDPPFATGLDFTSIVRIPGSARKVTRMVYHDSWPDLDSYLCWMDETLTLLRDLLAEDGALLLHCDWRAEAMLRLLLDDIFGVENFRNAIVWSYRTGGASRHGSLARKHDTILLYARSPRFRIRALTEQQYLGKPFMKSRRDAAGRPYAHTLLRDVLEGEIVSVGPDEALTPYNVRPVLNVARERLNYPTQKPLGLLRLLLTLASDPGDLVLDCCCGSGAMAHAAETLGRRWIASDASPLAIQTTRKRLLALAAPRPFVGQRAILEETAVVADSREDSADLKFAVEQSGATVTVRLTGYTPPSASILTMDAPPDERAASQGLCYLDSWSVDWDWNGTIFRHSAYAARVRTGARDLRAAFTHSYTAPGYYTLAIHAVDLAAHEMTRMVTVVVE